MAASQLHNHLELSHLRLLQALQECGSLVAAAHRLCVTQSALSHQVKALESLLGGPLFVRKSKPLAFTPAGQRLLQLAAQLLPAVEHACQELDPLVRGESGRIHLVIECHSCFDWIMPALSNYRRQWPAVSLDLSTGFHFEPLEALMRGDVDLVLTADPQPLSGISYQPLFRYESVLVLAPDHPLLQQEQISPQHLADQCLISYPVPVERLDIWRLFLQPAGVNPASRRQCEHTLMMLQLVASGHGVAALPYWAVRQYAQQGLVALRSLGPGVHTSLHAAMRSQQAHRPFMQAFVHELEGYARSQLQGLL